MRTGILLGILSVVTLGEYTVRFTLFRSIHCIVFGTTRMGFHNRNPLKSLGLFVLYVSNVFLRLVRILDELGSIIQHFVDIRKPYWPVCMENVIRSVRLQKNDANWSYFMCH